MTNIEKVKRILNAGHYVKVTTGDGEIYTITSCLGDEYTWIDDNGVGVGNIIAEGSTIEVIQRIPTAYKAGDKVLVLSNPSLSCDDSEGGTDTAEYIDEMVGKVGIIKANNGFHYSVYNYDKSDYWYFPAYCLAPVFDEDSLSGKEAKVIIDGKEYSATLKLV